MSSNIIPPASTKTTRHWVAPTLQTAKLSAAENGNGAFSATDLVYNQS